MHRYLLQLTHAKYHFLLFFLVFFLISYPLISNHRLGDFFYSATVILIFLSAMHAFRLSRRYIFALILLGTVMIGFTLANTLFPDMPRFVPILDAFATLTFNLLLLIYIVNDFLTIDEVRADTISGAICAYFLIGLIFGYLFFIMGILNPDAFASDEPLSLEDYIYFSCTTLTTLGFGDIAPKSNAARIFSSLESMIGVIYLATTISRLVAGYEKTKQTAKERLPR